MLVRMQKKISYRSKFPSIVQVKGFSFNVISFSTFVIKQK